MGVGIAWGSNLGSNQIAVAFFTYSGRWMSQSGSTWGRIFNNKPSSIHKPETAQDSFSQNPFHKPVDRFDSRSESLYKDNSSSITAAPYPMVSAPTGLASHDMMDDDGECPVCLEPLSFSFRLPGEKPHVVPECGHALHEVRHYLDVYFEHFTLTSSRIQACFSAVYGPLPGSTRGAAPRKTSLGVCGVCRRPMKVGDGDGGSKSNSE